MPIITVRFCIKKKGDIDRAIADFSKSIQYDKKYGHPYFQRGLLLAKLSPPQYEKAISDLKKYLELNRNIKDPEEADRITSVDRYIITLQANKKKNEEEKIAQEEREKAEKHALEEFIKKARALDDVDVCKQVLNEKRNSFVTQPWYAAVADEARRRSFSVGQCRAKIGLPFVQPAGATDYRPGALSKVIG